MSDEKIFCGSGKAFTFQNGGSKIGVMLDMDMLSKHFKEHGFTTQNGKRMMKIDVTEKREVDQYGKTHMVTLDTWKPDSQQQGKHQAPPQKAARGSSFDDGDPNSDIPF